MKTGYFLFVAFAAVALGQQPEPRNWTAAEDHQNMMDQLGIKALRPGPNGNENAPNHANYDESKANPYPDLPDPLVLHNGKRVMTVREWWDLRRPEIVEDFEREVIGRVPKDVPKVTWTAGEQVRNVVGERRFSSRPVTGHVDNSAYPRIAVDIQMTLFLPADRPGPAPVMIVFGFSRPGASAETIVRNPPPSVTELLDDGWGCAYLIPTTVQADNGAGLTKGVIGLVNKGQPRKPDDWGALRAWAWGASRALDYLETVPEVDSKHVGVDGVSRYGKAALVAMAFDPRFAFVLVGSSGEGGAKLHRRNFGEAVENLTGSGEYHWMAGNFLKYGASDATFGSKTPADLPVDAHELIALCAPRPTFISYGIPEKGDAKWLDQQGSFMATVAAGKVFRLAGAKDLGVGDDYRTARMPPVEAGLLDGQLAWRQHNGGHTDGPNWTYFLAWADRLMGRNMPADHPIPRLDSNSQLAHLQLIEKARQGGIDVYFEGDSITRRWGATDYPELLANWNQNFHGWNAADFGWGADRTQNILWRLRHGELDDVHPKVIVLLAGTNNIGDTPADQVAARAADVTKGIEEIVDVMRNKAPEATIIVTGIFPRNDHVPAMPVIDRVNTNLSSMGGAKRVRFLDINRKLADAHGNLFAGMMNPDKLHPALKGYQIWADALKPILTELLGPPAKEDHAPPPTGDPSRRK